ncbi:MAG: hypothetical protein OSJ61_03635 [Lachnospiraceae bacterium]|nr:hypothetical protein [Lachnospiraceae bacterium]
MKKCSTNKTKKRNDGVKVKYIRNDLVYLLNYDNQIRNLIRGIANEEKDLFVSRKSDVISIKEHNEVISKIITEFDDKCQAYQSQLVEYAAELKEYEDNYVKKTTYNDLNDKYDKLKKTNSELEKQMETLKNAQKDKLDVAKTEVQNVITEKESLIKKYEGCDVIIECYNNYRLLSEQVKKELEGIIYAPSAAVLFACVGTQGFIRRLSDYITKRIMKTKSVNEDTQLLLAMFDTMFDVNNHIEGREVLVRDVVSINEPFSTDKHSTISLQQGMISDVLFLGYSSVEEPKKCICKSIVEVKG